MKFTSAEITQIIVAIIGFAGLIIQGIIIRPKKPKKKSLKNILINVGIAIIFLLAIIFGSRPIIKHFYEPRITILQPKPNDTVETTIDMNGKYKNIDHEKQLIWIAAHTSVDQKYFMHPSPVEINLGKKTWENKNTVVGVDTDKNKMSRIIVLLINKNTTCHEEVLNHVNDKNQHGLDNLPKEALVLKDIPVYIK